MSIQTNLQLEINTRTAEYGDELKERFIQVCLKPLDPALLSPTYYIADTAGEKYNKPKLHCGSPNPYWPTEDDKPVDPPRDGEERAEFFQQVKLDTMKGWLERLKDGEFDQAPALNKPLSRQNTDVPQEEEHEDVTNLDMDESTETAVPEGVSIEHEKEVAPEPELDWTEPEPIVKTPNDSTEKTDSESAYIRAQRKMIRDLIADSPGSVRMALSKENEDLKSAMLKLGNEVAELKVKVGKHGVAITAIRDKLVDFLKSVPELIKKFANND